MRELSLIELDLVIGGYGEGSGGYDYGSYTFTDDGAGNAVAVVSESDYHAQSAGATADGWVFGGEGTYTQGGGFGVKVTVSKKC